MKTIIAGEAAVQESKRWYLIDAKEKVLGRMATQIAHILKGKHKAIYSPHQDVGDFVIVVNAEKIKFTGSKISHKTYFRHSGYPGGETITPISLMLQRHPERVIEYAVKRMLPKNSLGRQMFKKLKVYAGPEHPHQAQQPQTLELKY
ncbi:MAG: 50S ribosomal protein L13 [Calditrichaceae bacterium]|nr:50S ribosomal protein L13 [Calditrichaceae bacterium]MBN2708014.1 50S ribosomal protein L13 [Calditrichaceae bacterium]RQV93955.1 MAG: 50S ribosomal protein L13 [Calditrichota bacterium]